MKPSHRSLEAIALENATLGCAGRTFRALVAGWRAASADDKRLHALLCKLSDHELKSAEEAWRIAAWVEPRLDADGQRRVDQARRETAEKLLALTEPAGALQAELAAGLPSAPARTRLLAATERLWS